MPLHSDFCSYAPALEAEVASNSTGLKCIEAVQISEVGVQDEVNSQRHMHESKVRNGSCHNRSSRDTQVMDGLVENANKTSTDTISIVQETVDSNN